MFVQGYFESYVSVFTMINMVYVDSAIWNWYGKNYGKNGVLFMLIQGYDVAIVMMMMTLLIHLLLLLW